jgi:hypothetical protein
MTARRYPGAVTSEFVRCHAFGTSVPLIVKAPLIVERCVR